MFYTLQHQFAQINSFVSHSGTLRYVPLIILAPGRDRGVTQVSLEVLECWERKRFCAAASSSNARASKHGFYHDFRMVGSTLCCLGGNAVSGQEELHCVLVKAETSAEEIKSLSESQTQWCAGWFLLSKAGQRFVGFARQCSSLDPGTGCG